MKSKILIVIMLGLLLTGCNSPDEARISSALYVKYAQDIVINGGDPQFDINYIKVNGDTAEVSFNLLGATYKRTAYKTEIGEWEIR